MTINSCTSWLGSRNGENLQVISFYDGDSNKADRLEHSDFEPLRYYLELSRFLGWDMRFQPITLITSPHEQIQLIQESN